MIHNWDNKKKSKLSKTVITYFPLQWQRELVEPIVTEKMRQLGKSQKSIIPETVNMYLTHIWDKRNIEQNFLMRHNEYEATVKFGLGQFKKEPIIENVSASNMKYRKMKTKIH